MRRWDVVVAHNHDERSGQQIQYNTMQYNTIQIEVLEQENL